MIAPRLVPACKGWQRDLPGPHDTPDEAPTIAFDAPNHLDAVYLEVPRRTFFIRGVLMVFGLLITVATFTLVYMLLTGILTPKKVNVQFFVDLAIYFSIIAIASWAAAISFRLDLSIPCSEPIRFNRLRRKVYVYDFKFDWSKPFTRWFASPKSFDWDDLRAEAWKLRGATANGALIINEGVSLAVVKPCSNEVLDRFYLSGVEQTAWWAYICTYMQKGPEALKPCEAPMRHANDTLNPLTRLAPKVRWPVAMDVESRTAP